MCPGIPRWPFIRSVLQLERLSTAQIIRLKKKVINKLYGFESQTRQSFFSVPEHRALNEGMGVGGGGIELSATLITPATDVTEWSASRSGCLNPTNIKPN